MKISYAITVCDEEVELQRLVTFLLKHKELQDEIVISVIETSDGDYIFHIDADEYPHEVLIEQLPAILETNDVDLIWIPRVNTVEGLTDEWANKWGWRVTENGWVNYPDYQSRVFRNNDEIFWQNKVHERIVGTKTYAHLPPHEELSLYHPKTIEKQIKQNTYYEGLQK